MNANTIIFLHIPKTGGRSLQNILLRRYSKEEIITDAHEILDQIADWSDERKRNIRYLQGHFIYGIHNILPQECSYITVLRDPVDRVISHYYYIKRSPSHPINQVIHQEKMDLEGYITSGVCEEVVNDQTRLIAGVSRSSNIDVDTMLVKAKQNVDTEFIVTGIVERFDETVILLKRRLGLRNVFYGVRNQTIGRPQKGQIPDRILALIKERNYADIELYAYANRKLAKMIDAEGKAFINDVNRFKLLNRPYNELFCLAKKIKDKIYRPLGVS